MRLAKTCLLAGISAPMLMLSACGDGGGGIESASTTPPPPAPTTTPATAAASVTIFAKPEPGAYASVGVATNDALTSANARITSISTADADQPHIRYNSGGYYEVQLPGAQWDQLIPYKGLVNPGPDNNYFQPASVGQNLGYLVTSNSRQAGYSYSEMAAWGNRNLSLDHGFGFVAFGVPTPAGSVPVTGSAAYSGMISGTADVLTHDALFGTYDSASVSGTISLAFDFGAGSLGGSMQMSVNNAAIGSFAFANTVFSVGSPTYSGKFDTPVAGQNFFLGRFTGPHAEETIGAWALPFTYSGDGQVHQAIGAWIAKH